MTELLLQEIEDQISELTLIPSAGGRFEVIADGVLLFSKAVLGRHATADEVLQAIRAGQPVVR